MSNNAKISIILVATLVLAAVVLITVGGGDDEETSGIEGDAQVMRPNTHVLSPAPEDAPVFVEFLDFECEGCGALYPIMENLRDKYEGEVTFAIRYFPNEGHPNAMNAALAVEAVANQGKLEPMYEKMFETQEEWGHTQESRAPVFAGYARELGVDMDQYRNDVKDPATKARIEEDREEGVALGVPGTPALFLDGEEVKPESEEQLEAEIDAALEQ